MIKGIVVCLLATTVFSACDDKDEIEDPVIPNEEEVITTLIYTLTPLTTGEDVVLSFRDEDGDGPEEAIVTVSDSLQHNMTYTGSLLLLNETESPADTVNIEILEEADEHQFFFSIDGLELSVDYLDADSDGLPLGLSTLVNTADASSGTLTVILKHEPNKTAEGVESGDITNAGGETDIEVEFDVVIQ